VTSETAIRTERLELVPASLAHIHAELSGHEALAALLGTAVPASWPPGEYDRDALEYFKSKLEGAAPDEAGWYSWYVMARPSGGERESLVAAAGFLGPPTLEGVVEIGYSVVPEARGQGYAAEIVRALVEHAFLSRVPAVSRVIAHASEGNAASVSVLTRSGFRAAGAGEAPGTLRFERDRT
jgi:RimJ/RimL family protein N-acetyltransferase